MTRTATNDLDYLATRLHARRSRMAEAKRLDELCRLRTPAELSHAILPGLEFSSTGAFQRQLAQNLVQEISQFLKHLDDEAQSLMEWLLARFQLEDAKILLRGFLNHIPIELLQPHLFSSEYSADSSVLLSAKSMDDFVNLLPSGSPRAQLQKILARQRELPPIFILEAALDSGYFRELILRSSQLHGGEDEIIKSMVRHEASIFVFMLFARGRFHFDISTEMLSPLTAGWNSFGNDWLQLLQSAPVLSTMFKYAAGVIVDSLPANSSSDNTPAEANLATIERLAWQRLRRLANTAFRRSHMGVGAAAAYVTLRRLEIANLATLSESVRLGLGEENTRKQVYMVNRVQTDVAYA